MNAKQSLLGTFILAAIGGTIVTSARANKPQGRPFAEINKQIAGLLAEVTTLQQQVEILVGRVGTLEERATALDGAVAAVRAAIAALQTKIAANEGDVALLKTQLLEQQGLLSALQMNVKGVEAQLAIKQNIINGTCAAGSSIRRVLPDGSVECEIDDAGTAGTIGTRTVVVSTTIAGSSTGVATATCPPGYTMTGGGFDLANSTTLFVIRAAPSTTSNVAFDARIRNNTTFQQFFTVLARCVKLE